MSQPFAPELASTAQAIEIPQILTAPDCPAACAGANIASVVNSFGHPDISDGIRNIATFDIQTPQEEQICRTKYTAELQRHTELGEPLTPELTANLRVKIACGSLTVREFALLAFGVESGADLTRPALACIKDNAQQLATALDHAHKFGLIGLSKHFHAAKGDMPAGRSKLITWRDKRVRVNLAMSNLEALTWLLDIDPETIAEQPSPVLGPIAALRTYCNTYGGTATATDSREARLLLRHRYEQDLQNKVFFPDPVAALRNLYGLRQFRWRTQNQAGAYRTTQLVIEAPVRSGRADAYTFKTTGPNEHATRQAASRLVLEHLGATDLSLLDESR